MKISLVSAAFVAVIVLANLGVAPAAPTTWLVTSQHPEDLESLKPFVAEWRESGRILRVTLNRSEIPEHVRQHLRPITDDEVIQYLPKSRAGAEPDPRIQALISQADTARLESAITKLTSARSRAAGIPENRAMIEWARAELETAGFTASQDCYSTRECNVVATRAGQDPSAGEVLIVAHLDSVGAAFAGADDNASGTAGLLEMARVLGPRKHRLGLRFLVTNGEENGLVGSRAYVAKAPDQELRSIALAVNMDMIAYNSNGLVDLETNREFQALADWYAEMTFTYTTLRPNITIPAWGSDHVPFLQKGVPTLLTIEHWNTKTPCYHQACDKLDTLNLEYAAQIVRLNLAAVAAKAGVE